MAGRDAGRHQNREGMMEPDKGFHALQAEVSEWAATTFGEGVPQRSAAKLVNEALELLKNPGDIEEGADILIVLCSWLRDAGYSVDDLLAAAWPKHEKNKKREWKRDIYMGCINTNDESYRCVAF